MQSVSHVTSRSLRWAYVVLCAFSGVFLFWVVAFIRNGLYLYSYADIYWQHTASAGDWPFSVTEGVDGAFITPIFVCGLLARFVIPIATLIIVRCTLDRWPLLSRSQRYWYGFGSLLAVFLAIAVWLPISVAMYTWMVD